jgi:hypothetical protein
MLQCDYSRDIFLIFFTHAAYNVTFCENWCVNIECPNVHAIFCFDFFWHFNKLFYSFFIIGSHGPKSQKNTSMHR